ncbi:MAG: NADH-quinone oxidoreductase subunit C [Myxococcales bacterium]|nr:NADH-quinone oxidoreductase subunit C [Myxococcales bacterium]
MSKFALDRVQQALPDALLERITDRTGGEWGVVKPDALRDVASQLKNDPSLGFRLFVCADCVDRLQLQTSEPRFEVIYLLYSPSRNEHARLKVRVGEDSPEVPSLTSIFQGANWWERLVWDFYGIRFEGHPDLRRLLLYEEFKGHPLRKDYGLRERQPLLPERPIRDIYRGPGTSGTA